MNIFLVHANPDICAQALCDLRLNKMILETAQLLCTAHRHWAPDDAEHYSDVIYKVTHANHPCSVWLRKDINNYHWLLHYFQALHDEKEWRTGKEHLSFMKLYDMFYYTNNLFTHQYPMPNFSFNCSNMYPSTGDVFKDYKLCLVNKWLQDNREPTWGDRGAPEFTYYHIGESRKELSKLNQFERVIAQRKFIAEHPCYSN